KWPGERIVDRALHAWLLAGRTRKPARPTGWRRSRSENNSLFSLGILYRNFSILESHARHRFGEPVCPDYELRDVLRFRKFNAAIVIEPRVQFRTLVMFLQPSNFQPVTLAILQRPRCKLDPLRRVVEALRGICGDTAHLFLVSDRVDDVTGAGGDEVDHFQA